jgi:hypothetical protein
MRSRVSRIVGALAAITALFALAACSGLPTSGDVKSGLALGASLDEPDILFLASGPRDGAGPQDIVEGFIEAGITPADNWLVAQSFLTPEFRTEWTASAGVLIDASADTRAFTSDAPEEDDSENGDTAHIQVRIDQLAIVDQTGAYSETTGMTTLEFVVVKTAGEWRISKAPDGVVIDRSRFQRVYDDYPLQYFDQSWSRLVPDVRWLPRRATIATTITQSLIEGAPSPWLLPAVQSAFPADVTLARDAVPIDPDQIADVALSRSAQSLDPTTLARMRTQLQATLEAAGVHVSQVRFTVDGRSLDAGVVKLVEEPVDAGTVVLRDGAFGAVVGTEITPIDGISDEILGISQPIAAVDIAADETRAAVQLGDGRVFLAADGQVDPLDGRAGLVKPSIDPYGYIWSVPSSAPSEVIAARGGDQSNTIADAWPTAAAVSGIRVSADGARIAAIETIGGERWITVSAVIRDDTGAPTALGEPKPLTRISGSAESLVWLGPDRLGVLMEQDGPKMLTQIVGGPGTVETAPAAAVSLAGARSAASVRVLAATGSLFSRSGSAWRESMTGVLLLATKAGH